MSRKMRLQNKPERELLVKLLKEARLNSGMRQTDLARKLNRNQSYVSKYENKERMLGFIEVKLIIEAIGLSFSDFVSRFEKKLAERGDN